MAFVYFAVWLLWAFLLSMVFPTDMGLFIYVGMMIVGAIWLIWKLLR